MEVKDSNCCNSNSTNQFRQASDCCYEEKRRIGLKQRIGVGVLLIALLIAIISAYNYPNSTTNKDCKTSCEAESTEGGCCSK